MTVFHYKAFKTWYENNIHNEAFFEKDDVVKVWNLKKENDWEKHLKDGRRHPFLIRKIDDIAKMRTIPDNYPELYPNGVYVIPSYTPNWLMFVFPKVKSEGTVSGLFADHYSIPYNPDSSRRPNVQFHHTRYIPNSATMGRCMKDEYFFRDGTPMDDILLDDMFSEHRQPAIEMLTLGLVGHVGGGPPDIDASGKQETTKQARKKKGYTTSLADKWDAHKIQHIVVIGVKDASNDYNVTCHVYDAIKRDWEHHPLGLFFKTKSPNSNSIKAQILSILDRAL